MIFIKTIELAQYVLYVWKYIHPLQNFKFIEQPLIIVGEAQFFLQ